MNLQPRNITNLQMQGKRLLIRNVLFPTKGKNGLFVYCSMILTLLYTVFALIFPASERTIHGVVILMLMAALSYEDVREKRISMSVIGGIFVVSVIHTLLFQGDYFVWIAGAVFSVLMLALHLIKRDTVGVGDILLLGLGITSLAAENILSFLFLSFFLSSVYGIVLIALKRSKTGVPLSPCITLAWLAVFLL